jgi:subtilase family serine protease
VILARLTRKGLLLLAVSALLAVPAVTAVTSAQARTASAARERTGGAALASARLALADPDPSHITVLTAALNIMQDNYVTFAGSSPGPQDIFNYNISSLWLNGIDGTGTTVAVLEGWDDPALGQFMTMMDQQYGLPDPVVQTIYPSGPLPAQCPAGMVALGSYGSCAAWIQELRLDVLTVHLIAPYAKIVISATPADSEITDDPASNVAPPEMMHAIEYIAANHLANVISISDGTGESTYSKGPAQIHANDPGPLAAAAAGIPVLNGTGDCGVVQNLAIASAQCANTTTGPDTAAWDDNPWVTAVGGSVPNINPANGAKLGLDTLWHEGGIYSEGAGFSSIYARPAYQDGVAQITGSQMRAVPDITMDAQGGTSESTPMLAGVLALATQLNDGQNIGPINPALYGVLGPAGPSDGIADVVGGNNSVLNPSTGAVVVPGFTAVPGFDVASGWGTINAKLFVQALVMATHASSQASAARQEASQELSQLQHKITLSATNLPVGGTASVTSTGFLPGHPVQLAIDGTTINTLTAGDDGTVRYMLTPDALGLVPGNHVLTLQGMLITTTASFHSW